MILFQNLIPLFRPIFHLLILSALTSNTVLSKIQTYHLNFIHQTFGKEKFKPVSPFLADDVIYSELWMHKGKIISIFHFPYIHLDAVWCGALDILPSIVEHPSYPSCWWACILLNEYMIVPEWLFRLWNEKLVRTSFIRWCSFPCFWWILKSWKQTFATAICI